MAEPVRAGADLQRDRGGEVGWGGGVGRVGEVGWVGGVGEVEWVGGVGEVEWVGGVGGGGGRARAVRDAGRRDEAARGARDVVGLQLAAADTGRAELVAGLRAGEVEVPARGRALRPDLRGPRGAGPRA
ncbi:hypothetical protein CXF48_06850 [Corynebacterium bovis]|uniref:Uncharacterized protein n=1 Tax=Corynebacterium bovis TaxID=36808 RepID=A0A3R8PHA4_9CORY|nr:hypothetical protein CXF48_06850 [Corynebacterium bovis]